MKGSTPPNTELIDALRQDLPDDAYRAKLRARLLDAGISVGVGTTTAVAATSVAAATKVGSAGAAVAETVSSTAVAAGAAPSGATAAQLTAAAATKAAPLVQAGLWAKVAAVPVVAKAGGAVLITTAVALTAPPALEWVDAHRPVDRSITSAAASSDGPAPREASRASATADAPVDGIAAAVPMPQAPEASLGPAGEPPAESTAAAPAPAPAPARGVRAGEERSGPATAAPVHAGAEPAQGPAPHASLAAEAHLLERALRSIAEGDRPAAAQLLAEHRNRYPDGALRTERIAAERRLGMTR